MPAKKRPKPLYQRGKFALHRRPDRANLEIIWYDDAAKRERSASAGTDNVQRGIIALDRRYLEDAGNRLCPTCHRAWDSEGSPLVARAIMDYLILKADKGDYIRYRLSHVLEYLAEIGAETVCAQVDEAWIAKFRTWALARPVVEGGKSRPRSLAHVEGSVMQLAAVINAIPGEKALFSAKQMKAVAKSPVFRADVELLAKMFDYCLTPSHGSDKMRAMAIEGRKGLLAYLRLAVASWARPEAILEVQREQWHPAPQVLDLNPPYRQTTDKRRPMIPIARQMVPHLNAMGPNWIEAATIRNAWDKMRRNLGLPANREHGPKLIRRSVSTMARKRIGEPSWIQGEIMLGHVAQTTSDIYAIMDKANLGLALAATEEIIEEIEALAPGAYRDLTAETPKLSLVNGGKNG